MPTTEQLLAQIERLKAELIEARMQLRRAKDPTPLVRVSWKRLINLVHDACMDLSRVGSRWQLRLGKLTRLFRSLREIWELLIQEDWYLSDIFPPAPPPKSVEPRLPHRNPALLPYQAPEHRRQIVGVPP